MIERIKAVLEDTAINDSQKVAIISALLGQKPDEIELSDYGHYWYGMFNDAYADSRFLQFIREHGDLRYTVRLRVEPPGRAVIKTGQKPLNSGKTDNAA